MPKITHYINGGRYTGNPSGTVDVHDPATGESVGKVLLASVSDVNAAVDSASHAFSSWSTTSLARRAKAMYEFRNLLLENQDSLVNTITREHGKVLEDARGELTRGLENVEYACGIAEVLKGSFSESVSTRIDVKSIRQPLGVVAGITPFNFPAMVPLWMIPNAVACGNTFVLKPSEKDPTPSLILAQLFTEAGFPPGVLNVLQGDKLAVDSLLTHPEVKAVSFVGSTPVARYIATTATTHGKRVQALGGAKNHMVVLPDADLDLAADAAVSAAYGSAGERCMAISVAVAIEPIADALVSRIKDRIEDITVGPGTGTDSTMGPLITREHRDRVADYVRQGEEAGAKVIIDGRSSQVDPRGYFLGPTLIDHVTPDMSVYRDEIFGPVLVVVRVSNYETALQLIRDNQWGNGAALFTQSGAAARRFELQADAGMIGINVPVPVPVGSHSFGGWKNSLFGDTTMYGPEGVRFYTKAKVVTSRWPETESGGLQLNFPTNA